ncbi:ABC transporter ATP-binding protein [Neomegalonema sp.]|uniref:ABC transporter ATP-binding protein n=1 Tax=Neomegalonema sp. TaxID=2039713 RepID=UPI0026189E98|nr:ABC transporter ATP-binding protein [Neomegalonema sp.]MDD2868459.1 ABC transporter ATP-binding protein [Neomegalonema sp.]
MTGLSVEGLSLGYRGRRVISDLSLSLPPGRFTAILGPNGCGKSTLLRGLARLIPPESGRVTLDGEDLQSFAPKALARRLGLLPQAPLAPEGITVADLVARGRAPWRGLLSSWSPADEAARAEAMRATGVAEFAGRPLSELSGGQRQRVWIALALAQETEHLLLDEPTTWLDLPHQIEILRLLARLRREAGRSLVAVLHDLNLAARHADHLVLLAPGSLVAQGAPEEVLTPAHVAEAFGLKARILPDPVSGTPMVVPEEA